MAPPLVRAFWAVTIAAGVNDALDLSYPAVTATIAPGTYYSIDSLLDAVCAAINAATGKTGAAWYLTHPTRATSGIWWNSPSSPIGCVVIQAPTYYDETGIHFDFQESAPHYASSAHKLLGFSDGTPGGSYRTFAPRQHPNGWYADDPVAEDGYDRPIDIKRAQTRALSGKVRTRTFSTSYERTIALAFLPPHKVFISEEGASHVNEALERLFLDGAERLRWWPDASDPATYADYALDAGTKFDPRRLSPGAELYAQAMRFLRYV
jgi:hypothetical protein